VPVHCAAIPGELLESELFGHEKGAFTGALQRRIGMFEAANGGTLFLDEIGEMPLATQAKLLRALQEREIRRVGSQDTIKINVRIVCSTNRDLEQEVKQGKFREDLFYRINVVPLVLPPLRDRREDIPLLVGHFTRTFAARQNRPPQEFNARAMELMQQYPWPGNVRELEHAVERVLVTTDANPIRPEHLPFVIANAQFETSQRPALATSGTLAAFATGNGGRSPDGVDLTLLTETVERQAIEQALQRSGGVITEAARLLNVTRRILRYKMDKLGIAPQALAKGEEDKSVP
jgi:transcriptional regulator with GAF, ATPase, and Fis domain